MTKASDTNLRTVIVTAAIHRGFGSALLPPCGRMTPCLNLPALGRCQSVYSAFTASHRPVFLLNSRMGLFTVTPPSSIHEGLHWAGHPFSRSYGAMLPSSLTRGHSSALVCSTCLPVSDCGTVTDETSHSGFSRQLSVSQFALAVAAAPYHPSSHLAVGLQAWTGTSNLRMA